LVWYNQLPSWVSDGGFDNATLIEVMQNHITNVVEHYKGQCYAWDVVNEAIEDDGAWRSNVFLDTIGKAYIPLAFEAAAAADPDVKLYYNDYNIEYAGPKVDTAVEIVKLVQEYGVKIDGVGLQGHFISGQTPTRDDIKGVMSGFTDLGVEVAFTEVDIRVELPTDDAKLEQQATDYSEITLACVETENCIGFTIWDWNDAHSWVPGVFPGTGAALPWDENAQPKPAYDAILKAFQSGSNSTESTEKVFERRTKRGSLGQGN
jgi:endo-1,4-beta-xylanase